jgi:hypothetical protein
MRAGVNVVLAGIAHVLCLGLPLGTAADGEAPSGSGQWVPSFAITTGVHFGEQSGAQASYLLDGESADPTAPQPLRGFSSRHDRVVVPFVGANVELMTPSLRIWAFPRLFASAEVLPTFGSERVLALDGEPNRIRGPEVDTVFAADEDGTHYQTRGLGATQPRTLPFEQADANGQGMKTVAQVDQLSWGAKIGAAFAFELRGRQLRLKPSLGWYHFRVNVKSFMNNPTCLPVTRCTNVYELQTDGTFLLVDPGFLRESIVSGHDSGIFDGVGPGLDLEMDTARIGPIGAAIYAGIHAYYIPGDRDIFLGSAVGYNDALGNDTELTIARVVVDPWVYRGAIGLRFLWLGSSD